MYLHQTPPENAVKTLKDRVLFAVLWSDFNALGMPTMIARMTTSPAEEIANATFKIRLRDREAKCSCS